ncbi:MAG TPA: choice-of-anchor Q domain-containing protein [Candidatus Eremiobacteraceae bacterium]|nr:choice-of-anchor Q domain-containing protein [Candidatus Eremiobacteraceae bacterium]
MRAWCFAAAAILLLAGCAQAGSPDPAFREVGSEGLLMAPSGNTTLYVDGLNGSDKNDCLSPQTACKTIQHAVFISGSGDKILVAAGVYTENVTVRNSVQIVGAGPSKTIVDGQKRGSGFSVAFTRSDVTIKGFTVRNGTGSPDGGGIYHCFGTLTIDDVVLEGNDVPAPTVDGFGGAMYNCPSGTLTIINSIVRNNIANAGGGICNGGVLTIINSTFSGNTARDLRGGGAIFNYGVLHVANSTFNGNEARAGVGGAIHNGLLFGLNGGAQIDNTTIAGNKAAFGHSPGGGVYNHFGLPIYVQNDIIANNTPQNCGGSPLATEGFNLSSDATCDLDGAGDMNNVDPRLGSLHDNGGPTQTMALLFLSPAIDAGNRGGCRDWAGHLLKTDQRGMSRPDQGDPPGCDIGAYERQTQ